MESRKERRSILSVSNRDKGLSRPRGRVHREQTCRDPGKAVCPLEESGKRWASPWTEALRGLCRRVWARCADRILGSLVPTPPPFLKAWLQSKLLTTCRNETPFLRRKCSRALSEICLPWNFMTHFVSCNHFLSEDGSGLLWSLACPTLYHPFTGCENRGHSDLFWSLNICIAHWPLLLPSHPLFHVPFSGILQRIIGGALPGNDSHHSCVFHLLLHAAWHLVPSFWLRLCAEQMSSLNCEEF